MYSNIKSVQYLVEMLKIKKVRNVVISPGTSHDAIIRSLEEDEYFKTYNIVDERSAVFFAIGLIQELKETVAVCCTSGTATVNYITGVTEAYKRKMPLVVITADKNPYYLGQREDQMIDQTKLFSGITKYENTLPIIRNSKDEWYCKRILNEAFLEVNHHGKGPIHINIPIEEGMFAIGNDFTTKELPNIREIKRIDSTSEENVWNKEFERIKDKKILILYGQDTNMNNEKIKLIEEISQKYNCVVAVDKISNLHCKGTLEITRAIRKARNSSTLNMYIPDVVIWLEESTTLDIKFILRSKSDKFESWIISEEGKVEDYFKNLSVIFECSTVEFLKHMNNAKKEQNNDKSYYELWDKTNKEYKIPDFEYSNLYTVKRLMENIPENSILNLANSSTIRISQYFELDKSVDVYCNRGIHGIDGCMSTFVGQASISNKLNFLIIGDLAFFYDMNALWNRYIKNNMRIMLNNNSGAALFHYNQGLKKFPTLNENVAADHDGNAKGWAESRGFKYLSATNKKEFDNNLKEFIKDKSDKPILFEVITKKEDDARIQHEFYDYNISENDKLKQGLKNVIKKAIGR